METTHIQSQQNNLKAIEEQQGSTSSPSTNPHSYPQQDPEEINLLEYIYVLVKNKWWIIGAAILGIVLGHEAAKIKGPRYISEAVIAAKESDNSKVPNLSGLGMIGGMMASQLNISQNPGLDKIDLILNSKKFNAELIDKYNLLPMIYKQSWPKQYKMLFDTTRNVWRSGFQKPNLLGMGSYLKGQYLKKEIKNGLMTISIRSKDSTFTDFLMSKYLDYLNCYIKANVRLNAKENVAYLDSQLITITDPLLREKLQSMIASEMEKAMLVSQDAYVLIDPPLRGQQFKEKKMFPLVFGMGFLFLALILVCLFHALGSAPKTTEDIILINKIKAGLFKLKI